MLNICFFFLNKEQLKNFIEIQFCSFSKVDSGEIYGYLTIDKNV